MKRKEEAKTKALVVLMAFLLSVFSVVAVAGQVPPPVPIPAEGPVEPTIDGDYTKLQISPKHEGFEFKPGGEKEFTVKVKNKDEETVSTSPRIEVQPFGEYFLEEEWITVEPGSAEIKAGEEQEYTFTVKIPEDAEIGHYSAQVVFTNDTMPTPYPAPFPMYVNSLMFSVHVWEPPKIVVQPQHIHDRVEAGERQEYEIQFENKGDKAIAINPEIGGGDRWHGPFENTIPEGWLTIDAPAKVEANSKATVKVTVNVPVDAKGRYEGSINLNIDDPSIEQWNQEVHIGLEVWKQPTTQFREDFTVKQGDDISVEVTARQHAYDKYGGGAEEKEEPSFEVALTTPEGGKPTPEPSKTVKTGEISLGMDYLPPWEASSEGMYHVMSTEHSETYETTNATGGVWTLEILPRNAERFEYTVEIGE
ncbi:putative membrane protein [Candidatus Methanophagaceae archaeon]|nr:putative membrane protein [Methanophagales archaeon]